MSRTRVACAVLAFSTLVAGCRKESDKPQWDVDMLVPLVKSTFTIRDLLADSLLEVNGDNSLTLVYFDRLFGVDLDTLFDIPDTLIRYRYPDPPFTFNVPFGAGSVLPVAPGVTRFDVDQLELRYLELREGSLSVDVSNRVQSAILSTFGLPGATLYGVPFSAQQTVPSGTALNPSYSSLQRNLSGYAFNLTGPNYNEVNTLETQLSFQLDPFGSGAVVGPADSVEVLLTYSNLVPQYARGYFGNRTVHVGPESSDFTAFNDIISGTLDVDQVTMKLKVTNGIGVDARIDLAYLRARNTNTGAQVDLTNGIVDGPINLNRAVDYGNGNFTPSSYERTLDNNNSNIDLLLETLPDKVDYELDLEVNPLGDISNGNDFLYYDSKLNADLELQVPLNLIASDLTLQQTVEPGLPGTADAHAIQDGELKLFATNGFPFSAAIALEIVDGTTVLTTLPMNGTIASGILGPDLLVQSSTESVLTTSITSDQMDLLYSGARIRITTVFNTADQTQHLLLLDSYKLDLQITARGNYIVNGDE